MNEHWSISAYSKTGTIHSDKTSCALGAPPGMKMGSCTLTRRKLFIFSRSRGHFQSSGFIKTSLKWATAHRSRLFRNRITHHRLIGDRYPQHQTVLRSEVAVPVAFGRGEVFNELYVSGI